MVLQDYYFFNMGDHGGVLVAVKYFKNKGETREMYYSIDEGETWRNIEFNDKMLKVYGLMTEPGENTTVFTMFGSGSGHHQWLIIKVDLRNVFARNCTEDDYKFWTPTSGNVNPFNTSEKVMLLWFFLLSFFFTVMTLFVSVKIICEFTFDCFFTKICFKISADMAKLCTRTKNNLQTSSGPSELLHWSYLRTTG